MQPVNNVFDHPLTVGDAATLSLFGVQLVPWFYVHEGGQKYGLGKTNEQWN